MEKIQFPRLPDTVLLHIFGYLDDSKTLLDLDKSGDYSDQLSRVAADKTLWRKIRIKHIKSKQDLKRFTSKLSKNTKSISIEAFKYKSHNKKVELSYSFLSSIKLHCTHLTSLTLKHFQLSWLQWHLFNLPSTLTHLSLHGCDLTDLPSIRGKINSPIYSLRKRMINVTLLDLCECKWVKPCHLLAASHWKSLKKIILPSEEDHEVRHDEV